MNIQLSKNNVGTESGVSNVIHGLSQKNIGP